MRTLLSILLLFVGSDPAQGQGGSSVLVGGTDGSYIGNVVDALKVSATFPSAQPVSAASLPLPTGAATAANQATANTSLASIDAKTPPLVSGRQPVDGSGVTQPISGTVTSNQGTAAAAAGAWPTKIADGTNVAAVKAASTVPVAADPALVVTVSPNTASMPAVSRNDLTLSAGATSGSGGTKDSAGLQQLSSLFNLTTISGTGAYIAFHLQYSDDASNWTTLWDTPRMTATGTYTLTAARMAHTNYRYTYDIGGSTPSVSATVTTTLKSTQTSPDIQRFFYGDIDLSANGNISSTFTAEICNSISVMLVRGAGGANAAVQIFGSNDATNWISLTGNVAINASTSDGTSIANTAFRYYNAQVVAHAGAGITSDIQWRCH